MEPATRTDLVMASMGPESRAVVYDLASEIQAEDPMPRAEAVRLALAELEDSVR